MIRVATKNVYGDGLAPEKSIVPELLQAGNILLERLQQAGVEMRPFAFWSGENVDLAVFFDCPKMDDPELRSCLARRIPWMLVTLENMHLQPHKTYELLKPLASRILTYAEDEVDGAKILWLPYALDIEAGVRIRKSVSNQGRPYSLGMINSWKKSEMPGDLYAARNRLAIEAAKILGPRMFLAGAGWDQHLVYPRKWQRSFAKRFPRTARVLFGWPNKAYRGSLPPGHVKLPALAQCDFALVPENCCSLRGYITEKIFNALFAGCIPIYQGHPDAVRWLPADMFIPMEKFQTGADLVKCLETMSPDAQTEYLQAGDRFLLSQKAAIFGMDSHVKTFQKTLLSCLRSS